MKQTAYILTVLFSLLSQQASAQGWGRINYDDEPWVKNVSAPNKITRGLQDRHLALWSSHGYFYDINKGEWRWQRPYLFCTTEDLYTQTIVTPYLIPMLENAGAIVFSPRERDWQRHEVIVDNDDHTRLINYLEVGFKQPWRDAPGKGFAQHVGNYIDGENPFTAGTARLAKTTSSKSKYSQISYQPNLPEAGRYAVYVSYQTLENSIDDAHYTVWHRGQKTEFRVNQQMGGSTWVYLGTFDFDEGCNQFNRVTLTNQSSSHGVVTADAVRFGGGMGNIQRGQTTSGMPRCLEGARYATQWMGMPYDVYSRIDREDDYKDDINSRSLTTNYLAGGSCYHPGQPGLKVPLELSLAVHSDAGFAYDGQSIYGTLTISTTSSNGENTFSSGLSRQTSKTFATNLFNNLADDLRQTYGKWTARRIMDENYSETRLPDMPSAILETLSHQSFPDMRYGQDPNFKFTLARSVYKTILRFVSGLHDEDYVVTPLTPTDLHIEQTKKKGEARLAWTPVADPLEPSAKATDYIVYTASGHSDFDNGVHVHHNTYTEKLQPGELHSFKVAAANKGGRSFPSEVVSFLYQPGARHTILVVNGFHRLSAPAVIDDGALQGFDMESDPGVTYGRTAGWAGGQLIFDRSRMGIEDETGLGYSSSEFEGTFIAGNDFNYIQTHAQAIQEAGSYNIVSCSVTALENGLVDISRYPVVDLILGLERDDGHSLVHYKTFSPQLQAILRQYTRQGGALFVSGSYVGSDMQSDDERAFLCDVLKCSYAGKDPSDDETVSGLGISCDFFRNLNERHYAATQPDILQTAGADASYHMMTYSSGHGAAVAYGGNDYRSFTMGFPFECIKSETMRAAIMKGILNYLLQNN